MDDLLVKYFQAKAIYSMGLSGMVLVFYLIGMVYLYTTYGFLTMLSVNVMVYYFVKYVIWGYFIRKWAEKQNTFKFHDVSKIKLKLD